MIRHGNQYLIVVMIGPQFADAVVDATEAHSEQNRTEHGQDDGNASRRHGFFRNHLQQPEKIHQNQ